MRFSVRGFRAFGDWVGFEGSSINVLYGPNASGKSSLAAACLLLREQEDPFRLSFAGGAHGLASFREAVADKEPEGRIEFIIGCSVDAAAALFPPGPVRPSPVLYDFRLGLSYAGDPFDGSGSGILVESTLDLLREGETVPLYTAKPCEGGGELSLSAQEILSLPFVRARAVEAGAPSFDSIAAVERAMDAATSLVASSRGPAAARIRQLRSSLEAARREALLNREVERLVLDRKSVV
jgi:hypothetical protein